MGYALDIRGLFVSSCLSVPMLSRFESFVWRALRYSGYASRPIDCGRYAHVRPAFHARSMLNLQFRLVLSVYLYICFMLGTLYITYRMK